MATIQDLKNKVLADAQNKIKTIQYDYNVGARDCRNGIYDKWYRYHRADDGQAYDCGWVAQNQTTQVEIVQFI